MIFDFISNLVSIVIGWFNDILNMSIIPNVPLSIFVLFVLVLGISFSFPRYFL